MMSHAKHMFAIAAILTSALAITACGGSDKEVTKTTTTQHSTGVLPTDAQSSTTTTTTETKRD